VQIKHVTIHTINGTLRKRCCKSLESNSGIRGRGLRYQLQGSKQIKNRDTRQQLHLKIERTSEEFDRKAFGLEFMKRATGMSSRLWKMRKWTLWRGHPPPEQIIKNWALWRGRPQPKQKKSLLAVSA
jgi:hypothetical protein